ncbi:molybdopterin-dependent oxidoreductase [Nocardioides lentus]|uniref:Molybdopterin-dependent oxidoreductase n=1 Tax=Nocardioides lentus TaxID=338077 RepID=A0ABN2PBM3_9ACTN
MAGLFAGLGGVAASHLVAALLHVRESPVVAVAETVVRLLPTPVVEWGIEAFGSFDKVVLVVVIVLLLAAVFTWAGRLARRRSWLPAVPYGVLAGVGAVAVLLRPGATTSVDLAPVAAGLLVWLGLTAALTAPLRRQDAEAAEAAPGPGGRDDDGEDSVLVEPSRRTFLTAVGAVAVLSVGAALGGEVLSRTRRGIERARSLLALDVSRPMPPPAARVEVEGISPWMTRNGDFYRIDTAFAVPTIDPADWQLRIHGLVEREVVVDFADLVDQPLTEAWATLSCVSNEVGGDLIGNAWWSGVPTRDLLALAGPVDGADAVMQTSEDGWTCATPLEALTDDRPAMLAVAMNGEPLPVEHGFPVRAVVPGLYGYVSACKWVVDWEVTRFDDVSAYWTERGWSEEGPVKLGSRIDVPTAGADLDPGDVVVAGVAWRQHTGIAGVQVSVDGGAWTDAEVASADLPDSWVQWRAVLPAPAAGDHAVRVRAIDADGEVQTGAEAAPAPDGATGWHEVDFSVREA